MAQKSQLSVKQIISRALFCFAALSLLTAFILSCFSGSELESRGIPMSETVMGPYKIDDANTILHAKVEQRMPLNTWSNVTISLLNAKKQYLTGFGDGFWHEDGRDAEGYYWNQQVNSYEAKLVVNKPGEYYLKVSPESDFSRREKNNGMIKVTFSTLGFSYVPHFAAGVLALIAAIVLRFFSSSRAVRATA